MRKQQNRYPRPTKKMKIFSNFCQLSWNQIVKPDVHREKTTNKSIRKMLERTKRTYNDQAKQNTWQFSLRNNHIYRPKVERRRLVSPKYLANVSIVRYCAMVRLAKQDQRLSMLELKRQTKI